MREKTIQHVSVGALFAWLFLFFAFLALVRAYAAETRVFDQANLFDAAEKQGLERQTTTGREEMKLDFVVVTTNQAGGKSVETYADDFHDRGGYGYGARRPGVLHFIDMGNRRIHVSTAGGGIQLLSDSEIEKLLGLGTPGVKSGNYTGSAPRVFSGIRDSYRRAQRKDWAYDVGSGVWTKKKHLSPLMALESLVVSLTAALGAVTGVKRNCKMQDGETCRASTVVGTTTANGAVFDFGEFSDRLPDRNRVGRHMRHNSGGSGGGRSNGPHGSSSAYTSSGGDSHGGGDRSF